MAIDRRRRPLDRRGGVLRDASLIVIAMEGEKTEKIYFDIFHSSRLKIVPIPCKDGRSDPVSVLKNLTDFKKKMQFGSTDTFWLVVDKDKWTAKNLAAVRRECRQKQFNLLVSNPRFEVWLGLHFEEPLPEPFKIPELIKYLKRNLGSFSKRRYPASDLSPLVERACQQARERDDDQNDICPASPGSRVYLLAEHIIGLM